MDSYQARRKAEAILSRIRWRPDFFQGDLVLGYTILMRPDQYHAYKPVMRKVHPSDLLDEVNALVQLWL